jgi:hypothetical protein
MKIGKRTIKIHKIPKPIRVDNWPRAPKRIRIKLPDKKKEEVKTK